MQHKAHRLFITFMLLAASAPLLADTTDISPLTTLHTFGVGDDGGPHERLIGASDLGAVFRVTADGTYERIHDFSGGLDGQTPWGGVVQASDGDLYGTTQY